MSEPEINPTDANLGATVSEPHRLVDHFFRHEYAQLVATLTRRFGVGNWELVEDVVQAALQRALASWSRKGIPDNPAGWLHRVAVNNAIDVLRRDKRWGSLDDQDFATAPLDANNDSSLNDDMLRMIFVCCDPCVPPESQIALALKTLCGFGNREIARALLTTEASVAKRVTRAKQSLREEGVEPSALEERELKARLSHVQAVIYLLFNEGYSSTTADKPIREELCEEAVRLGLVLAEHPATRAGSTSALFALLLFHAARLDARLDAHGTILLLREQDRNQWDHRLLREAFRWFRRANQGDQISRYHAEAWVASEHCRAGRFEDTNWENIAKGYDLLCQIEPSPVHALNRAIAIGYRDGPDAGLAAFSAIESSAFGQDYYLWHATHAHFAKRTGDPEAARAALQTAWKLAPTNAEKELISRKLDLLAES